MKKNQTNILTLKKATCTRCKKKRLIEDLTGITTEDKARFAYCKDFDSCASKLAGELAKDLEDSFGD